MTAIIALSGKKQAGKSTLAEYLKTICLCKDKRDQGGQDEFFVSQDKDGQVFIETDKIRVDAASFFVNYHNTSVCKIYSFADALKEFCVDVLGLRHEQVWGTDEQKNTVTEMTWETMPDFVRWRNGTRQAWPGGKTSGSIDASEMVQTDKQFSIQLFSGWVFGGLREGAMTAREIMQVFGTDIMRNMFTDRIWVNATFRKIRKDDPQVAIIADLRFPSEMQALQENNGHVIRLDRSITNKDQHPSEVALDNWNWINTQRCLRIPDGDVPTRNKLALDWLFQTVIGGETVCSNQSGTE